ncbi:transcription factor (predicted) [Penicillium chermesinum]|nr:transcription factor (predicted) [Penicillium chermesinum]
MATSKAWLHIGLAVRMAQMLRMRNEYNWRYVPRKREIRRRTFWACVILDRLVAYCTFRTQTIDVSLINLHLPCNDIAFAFGHDCPGPKVELGVIAPPDPAESLLACFVKVLLLWSPVAQAYVDRGRRSSQCPLFEPTGKAWHDQAKIKEFLRSLPDEMQWSESNIRAHRCLGQLSHFIGMHFLLQHALFLPHHEYLPQLEDADILESVTPIGRLDAEGLRSDHISISIAGANRVVEMLRLIDTRPFRLEYSPPGICLAIPMVTSASVLLWIHHCSRLVHTGAMRFTDRDIDQAASDVDYLLLLLDGWARTWSLAKSFANSIRLLNEFYQTLRGVDKRGAVPGTTYTFNRRTGEDTDGGIESEVASPAPRYDGHRFPELLGIPHATYYKIRLITGLVHEQPELGRMLSRISNDSFAAVETQSETWGKRLMSVSRWTFPG